MQPTFGMLLAYLIEPVKIVLYISLFTTKVVQYMQEYKYKYKKTDNHKEDRQSR